MHVGCSREEDGEANKEVESKKSDKEMADVS
jgi:hypothetical protein